jgi:TRAP-type C4-dicarboxylate transport system permease small subunit
MIKIKKLFHHFEVFVASIAFAIMLLVVIANVLSRMIFSRSFGFTEEIAFICFTYSVFFGVVLLFKTHALIAIDFVVEKLPTKMRKITNILNFCILIGANAYFSYLSFILTMDGWARPTAFLGIPYTFIYLAALIAFALMLVYSIGFLIRMLQGKDIVTSVSPENQF